MCLKSLKTHPEYACKVLEFDLQPFRIISEFVFPPERLLPAASAADFTPSMLIMFGAQVTLRHGNNKVITPTPALLMSATVLSIFGHVPPALLLLFGSQAKELICYLLMLSTRGKREIMP